MDKSLLEKLPIGQGHVYIEDHWTAEERDKIIEDVAKLGAELRIIAADIQKAKRSEKLAEVRGGIALALLHLEKALLPMFGAEPLWPLHQATELLNLAAHDARHWLVTLPKDEPHLPRSAPYRDVLKAVAAATLEFFYKQSVDLKLNQHQIAEKIASAMSEGGFRVRPVTARPIAARTVQDWRNQFSPGKRRGRAKPRSYVDRTFTSFSEILKVGRGEKSTQDYFDEVLTDIKERCREGAEMFNDIPPAKLRT